MPQFHYVCSESSYDAGRQKWKQVYDDGATSETTYFAGRVFEKNINTSDTDHRHYVMANGRAVAMFVERTSQSDYVRYFTHDHLGSTDGIVKSDGTMHVGESFSAFGERRDPNDWVGDPSAADLSKIAESTDRAYTDHISLEESSLVHMNGRVFDAEIGRFLSPDPYVANPMNTQGFNRYAYVQNNPMRYTDPSGFTLEWCAGGPGGCLAGAIFGTALNFLFGGDDEPPPPPDFCKDNTRGCGFVANSQASSFAPSPPKQPMKRRIKICFGCGGGVFGIGVSFGGPGTGNPLILWGNESDFEGVTTTGRESDSGWNFEFEVREGYWVSFNFMKLLGLTLDAGSSRRSDRVSSRWTTEGQINSYSEGRQLIAMDTAVGTVSMERTRTLESEEWSDWVFDADTEHGLGIELLDLIFHGDTDFEISSSAALGIGVEAELSHDPD